MTAIDIHENENPPATLAPETVTSVGGFGPTRRDLLYPNTPDPFNPQTRLIFEIQQDGPVTLKIFDVSGRMVRVLVNQNLVAGRHEVTWDGRDQHERVAASGAYFAQLKTVYFTQSRKMVLSK